MTEQNPTTATTAPAAAKATPAKATASKAKAPATSKAKATASKAKAPAKAAGKATEKPKATSPKKPAQQGVLATASGVSHPGPLWLEAMHKQGLSQTACATEMGVAPMTLNRLINGHGIPTARVTLAFARVTKQAPAKVWKQVADFELALAQEQEQAGK